ncbi:MAG: hypothetical protein DRO90_02695 [Candidatus Altiarchaeales archaeon]|nr:MAG: hypothetical protein DRO90_02695 [Candidatus Altiarchaeales archaeon]
MWTVEIAMFLLPSIVFLYYCNKNLGLGRIIPYILIPLYSIMAISTILTYIIGSHYSLFYPRGDIDLRWMPETILFLIPTIICLIIAEKMRISKDRSILPFALTPIVYILLFSGIFVYILGIHKSLKISEMNLLWIIEVLIFITPAILFALIVDRIRIKRHKKSILIIPFYVIGFVFVIATLLRFIFGLNDFLYGDLKNLNWFIESVLYLIPGVLLLYVAESDIIDVKKPTKWLSDLKKIENLQ